MDDDPRPVRQCVCFKRTFAELKASGANTLDEIVERFQCTTGCGLCKPYILRMLETGETQFEILATE